MGGCGIEVEDLGTHSEVSVDYPDFGMRVAAAVSRGDFSRGILLCGSGIGMSMVANRFPHVRAALCTDLFAAIMSRKHNDANILVLGGRVTGEGAGPGKWSGRGWKPNSRGGRHQGRLDKFDQCPDPEALR